MSKLGSAAIGAGVTAAATVGTVAWMAGKSGEGGGGIIFFAPLVGGPLLSGVGVGLLRGAGDGLAAFGGGLLASVVSYLNVATLVAMFKTSTQSVTVPNQASVPYTPPIATGNRYQGV